MTFTLLQDGIVACIALAAAVVVARRLIGFASAESSPKCANCESGACVTASPSTSSAGRPAEHPLVFIRSSQH